jgi:type II secretory ATPase GspE/PulE/Tfp pilus assembly ATPase PilB-like protein
VKWTWPGLEAPPFAKLAWVILVDSIRAETLEICCDEGTEYCSVLYRVDGTRREVFRLSMQQSDRLVRRLKLMADMLLSDPRSPQKGSFDFGLTVGKKTGDYTFDVESVPTSLGTTLVLRRTRSSGTLSPLDIPPPPPVDENDSDGE